MMTFLLVVYFLGAGWSIDETHRQNTGEHLPTTWSNQIDKYEQETGWTTRKDTWGNVEFVRVPKRMRK